MRLPEWKKGISPISALETHGTDNSLPINWTYPLFSLFFPEPPHLPRKELCTGLGAAGNIAESPLTKVESGNKGRVACSMSRRGSPFSAPLDDIVCGQRNVVPWTGINADTLPPQS